ncbi:ParB N-terminal domain-containing protein [Massilia sp. X63]|uniref:ParB N-terminal domain-containing protein n=1 Tax=Massilia sp. X63 TaxID=3237285 RepID=UPI0034DCFFF6
MMELHPLCTLFPRISGAEFEALKADILAHGLREPIVVHAGFILDGGNRYRACVEAGVEPTFKDFTGDNPVSFVLSANLHRRHLSAGQQAAIVASAQDWTRAQTVGNPTFKTDAQKCNVAPLETVADRAAQSGASVRTQKMADAVAKASPDLAKQVAHGEISLPKAVAQIEGKPAKAKRTPSANDDADDDQPDLASELEAADKEIRRLSQLVETLSSGNDLAQQVADWSLKFDQLSGRNAQLMRTSNEAQSQARYQGDLLAKIRKQLGVTTNAEILPAIARRAA